MKTYLTYSWLLLACFANAQPYEPRVIWDRSGQTDSSAYGYKILPLGDQNDDGFADWAVQGKGNYSWDGNQESYLEFFLGGESLPTQPNFVFQEDPAMYYQSWFVDETGDLNGDGFLDWMISFWPLGAPPYSLKRIFFGGQGFSSEADMEWTVPSGTGLYPFGSFFGNGHGDFNGDGCDDLFEYDFFNEIARIYYGGNPMDTIPDWVLLQPPQGIIQTIPYAVGDFNGDGATDFMLFDWNNGNLGVFMGGVNPDSILDYFWSDSFYPQSGIDSLNGDAAAEWGGTYVHLGRPELSPVPDYILNSRTAGYAVDGGDFNSDGFHDLILYTTSTAEGNPFGALDLHLGHPWLNPDPVFEIEGDSPPFNLRGIYTAAGLGDVNGDGLGDFAIGVWNETFGPWRGRCVIIGGDTLRVAADPAHPELSREIAINIYPNPFNAATTIKFTLPWSERFNELTIYNALGQTVRHEVLPPFVSQVTYGFDAQDLPSGTYFVRVESGTLSKTQTLILIR